MKHIPFKQPAYKAHMMTYNNKRYRLVLYKSGKLFVHEPGVKEPTFEVLMNPEANWMEMEKEVKRLINDR